MTIEQILFLACLAPPFMWLFPSQWRQWGVFGGSLIATVWLIGGNQIGKLDVLLCTLTLALIASVWWLMQHNHQSTGADDKPSVSIEDRNSLWLTMGLLIAIGVIAAIQGGSELLVIPIGALVTIGIGGTSLQQLLPSDRQQIIKTIASFLIILIILILVGLKVPVFSEFLGQTLGDSAVISTPLVWVGFSYVAFRLIAVLLDYRAGRLSKMTFTLRDLMVYTLFFPAYTAGPIDRAQRFIPELNKAVSLEMPLLVEGTTRIAIGLFKKFVIADTLALVSMNPTLIDQTQSTVGLWVLVYLYAFQIYFDFSGYSDVAIGLGRMYGITLPENFDRPYIQANLQQFWQRWHMTLSTWFRVYYFTPLSRTMLLSQYRPPQPVIILIAQLSTMILIGLWHGITVNFFLWGLWHGVGLFLHKMLADNTRGWYKRVTLRTWSRYLMVMSSVFTTFHFVAIGWVFFALSSPADSFQMLARLFGVQ